MKIFGAEKKDGPTCSYGIGVGFTTASYHCPIELCGLVVVPLTSPGCACNIFCWSWGGDPPIRLPVTETLSGRKCPVVRMRVSGIRSVHLTDSALVNIPAVSSRWNQFGWVVREPPESLSGVGLVPEAGYSLHLCFYGGAHRTARKTNHYFNILLEALHSTMAATFWHWRRQEVSA